MKKGKHLSLAMLTAMPFVNPITVSDMGGDPKPKPLKTTTNQQWESQNLPHPKSPVVPPQIGIEEYTLYI